MVYELYSHLMLLCAASGRMDDRLLTEAYPYGATLPTNGQNFAPTRAEVEAAQEQAAMQQYILQNQQRQQTQQILPLSQSLQLQQAGVQQQPFTNPNPVATQWAAELPIGAGNATAAESGYAGLPLPGAPARVGPSDVYQAGSPGPTFRTSQPQLLTSTLRTRLSDDVPLASSQSMILRPNVEMDPRTRAVAGSLLGLGSSPSVVPGYQRQLAEGEESRGPVVSTKIVNV